MSKGIIDKFNDSVNIKDVYEKVTGFTISKEGNCKCPFHSSNSNDNAAIDQKKNWFSCFSHLCAKGMKPYEFIAKYNNLENEPFPVIAQKINEYYPNSFEIYSKNEDKKNCILSNFYYKIEDEFRIKIQKRIDLLNDFVFDKYGIEFDAIKIHQLWNCIKFNEFYALVSEYIVIDDNVGCFKIDEERLKTEITNRALKLRDNRIDKNKAIKNVACIGKDLSEKYKLSPSNNLKERIDQYRFEYQLLKAMPVKINKSKLNVKDKLKIATKSGLQYLGIRNIDVLFQNNSLYELNRQVCEAISEKEKNAFICGNIDYTISMVYIKPFNLNNKFIEQKEIVNINKILENIRKENESSFKDKYFYNKELMLNKKLYKGN